MRISEWSSDVCSSDLVATPHRWLREARRNQPVFFMPKYGWYVVTRLDDITRIANDPGTFSNRMFVTVPEVPARFRDRLPNGFPMKVQLAAADPPAHGRLKRFMQAALSPDRKSTRLNSSH